MAGTGHRVLHGRDTFGEGLDLPLRLGCQSLSQGWAWVQWPRSPGSLALKGDLGMSGSQVVQAAVLSQSCR